MGRRWLRAAGRRRPIEAAILAADRAFVAGDAAAAEARLTGVVAELEEAYVDDPDAADVLELLAKAGYLLGVARRRQGRDAQALAPLLRATEALDRLHAADARGDAWGRPLASATHATAEVECRLGHWSAALATSRRALELWAGVVGERWAPHRAFALQTFAEVRLGAGSEAGAELDEARRRVDDAIRSPEPGTPIEILLPIQAALHRDRGSPSA